MSECLIKNESLEVVISSVGAEMQRVTSNNGTEFLWSGDEKFWNKKAPVLFPICGGLKDGKFTYKGEEYFLGKHGFARTSEFILEDSGEDFCVYLLKSSEETRKSYPFDFEFRVFYKLDKNKIIVKYSVKNLEDKEMYFSLGAHESYSCPEGIEDYIIEFNKEETLDAHDVCGALIGDNTTRIITDSKILPLKTSYFEIDALVFKKFKSNSLTLKNSKREMTLDFDGFTHLLIWTIPGAPYVCIEPWCGIPNGVNSDYPIETKEGIIKLGALKEYEIEHSITYKEV